MTYAAALAALARRRETHIRLGLARFRRVLERLGQPQQGLRCLHVAGTNGKGSTCAILESVLRAAGLRTGLYLSPHLVSVRERIQAGGRPIGEADFARQLGRVLAADPERTLTYFELLTGAAFLHFREQRVDAAVLETGLGGRLDATNVIAEPLACLITSIDFDHKQWLGGSLPEIASEKAGIIKPRVPVFCPSLPRPALAEVARRARACRAPLTVVRRAWRSPGAAWRSNRQSLTDGPRRYELSLLGLRQGRNAALAKAALDRVLPVSEAAWRAGLRQVRLPARFEVFRPAGRTVILDGAHNPEAVGQLVRTLQGLRPGRVRWLVGLMRDKDLPAVASRLRPVLTDAVATAPSGARALHPATLAEELRRQAPCAQVRVVASPRAALRAWLRDPAAPRTAVVCGSFYLAAEVRKALQGGRNG